MLFNPVEVAVEIVAAYVSYNSVPTTALPNLIEAVHVAVTGAAGLGQASAAKVDSPNPMAPIGNSVTPDYLVCLDDGKRFKSLRRHLALLGMTPEQYRVKWGLPPTYPMVAANYAAKRSEMAKRVGLGRMRKKSVEGATATGATGEATAAPPPAAGKRKPGRPRKAIA